MKINNYKYVKEWRVCEPFFVILNTHLYKDRTVCCNCKAPTVNVLMIKYTVLYHIKQSFSPPLTDDSGAIRSGWRNPAGLVNSVGTSFVMLCVIYSCRLFSINFDTNTIIFSIVSVAFREKKLNARK